MTAYMPEATVAVHAEAHNTEPLLGRGIYDVAEVARIVRRHPDTVARWTRGADPLHHVESDRIISFLDVISLWVISELVMRGVPKREIRVGGEYVAEHVGTNYPFAHQSLATVGAGFFGKFREWVDLGKGGQRSFPEVIEELLSPIEFGPDLHASVWRPAEGVWLNPKVQAGTPCVDGTRVPTRAIADLEAAGDHIEDIADDLSLDIGQVRAAVQYERAA
ncbi:DUF433 domain-containing protein [Candidatus Spongiisocius sp.]|uniref:DUF433 domain-containing protein n=1 Tax=Candidatus Spongiisocius sp. TaxID=3101273 RepID=UPI003B5BF128